MECTCIYERGEKKRLFQISKNRKNIKKSLGRWDKKKKNKYILVCIDIGNINVCGR